MWLKNSVEIFELGDTLEVVPEKWNKARMPDGTRVRVIAESVKLSESDVFDKKLVMIKWLSGPLAGVQQTLSNRDEGFKNVWLGVAATTNPIPA